MTEEAIMAQGASVVQECAEENCIISLGNKIGADYVVKGIVSKFRTMFTLTIQIYETEHGMLIANSDPIEVTNVDSFIPKIRETAPDVFKRLVTYKERPSKKPDRKPDVPKEALDFSKEEDASKGINKFAVALGTVGIASFIYGVVQNSKMKESLNLYHNSNDEYVRQARFDEADVARNVRNVGYVVGAVFLAGGIVVQIAF
jgi:hypothetical protein